MYLWVGCKLSEDFEQEVRCHCLILNRQIGLDTVAFELPQHISLKISFQTDCLKGILEYLEAFLSAQQPFDVQILRAEQNGHILWLTVAGNEALFRLHRELDIRLETLFDIPQHEFDRNFAFHSTLFMDKNTEKIAQMENALNAYPFARKLPVDTFLLGISETGAAGTYRVIREIKV